MNGGHSWEVISPDLSRGTTGRAGKHRRLPDAGNGADAAARRHLHGRPVLQGRQSDLGRHGRRPDSPHPRRRQELEQRDAARRSTSWSKISHALTPGVSMRETAYAAVNRFRLDDLRPHIYRTHDGGKTWTGNHQRHSPDATWSMRCAKTPCALACFTPAPSARFMSPSMTAANGIRSG